MNLKQANETLKRYKIAAEYGIEDELSAKGTLSITLSEGNEFLKKIILHSTEFHDHWRVEETDNEDQFMSTWDVINLVLDLGREDLIENWSKGYMDEN